MTYDVIIVGAGIVGLATAHHLLAQSPGLKLCVIEKEDTIAAHQSSHNSGVIHSGIYYKPGSLKAGNCFRGHAMLIEFCKKYGIDYELCGKIIVATEKVELPLLENIYQRGLQNGLGGIRKIGPEETLAIEPHVKAVASIWVPQAGIIHYPDVAAVYQRLILERGGIIKLGEPVKAIQHGVSEKIITTDKADYLTKLLINCAGLWSDKLAKQSGQEIDYQILPFRGEYYELKKEKEHLVRNLIYPVPDPNFPFLGVHFTRMIKGGIEAGPNAVLAFRREGYTHWQIHPGELMETLGHSGFQIIARKYWKTGLKEMKRSFSKTAFVKALQKLIPEITTDDVVPGRAGVRAMACGNDGELVDDFMVLEKPGIINVCNAPSPAATASLSIGLTVAERGIRQLI